MKYLIDFIKKHRTNKTAIQAKERLNIIISHEKISRKLPNFLPNLKKDLIGILAKYVNINTDQIQISFDSQNGYEILELNITLPSP